MEILLLFTSICILAAEATDVQCSNLGYGRSCVLENSPEVMKIIDNQLFVGTVNSLQVFQLENLQISEGIDLSSDPETVEDCTADLLGNGVEDCKNYIRTIQPYDDQNDQILVCGTNAYHPKCTIHMENQPETFTRLSGTGVTDDGYSPNSKTHPIVAHLASNGRFFSATRFGAFDTVTPIRMSPRPRDGDSSFTVGTPLSDPSWLNQPNFISVYEHGEYMYFFISEPAYEIQEVRYSRAIRICKTDDGISSDSDPRINHFRTFQKARMECSVKGEKGSIPFHYNDLQSTFLLESDNGSAMLYGVFNSPINGPAGGAICKFSFDSTQSGSITEVFEGMSYLVQDRMALQTTWGKALAPSFSCPGGPGPQRSDADSQNFQLQFESITPTQALPLFLSRAEFLDKIVVDSLRYGEDNQEILYFSNLRGDIEQVVLSSENSGTEYRHTVYESDGDNEIRELIIHHQNDERSLIASIQDRIIQIPRGRCSSYSNCFSCFDSRDAYCGWHPTMNICVNKYAWNGLASALIQSFSADEATITETCGILPPSSSTAPPPLLCVPMANQNTDATTEEDCTTKNVNAAGLPSGNSEELSVPIIAGATAVAFIIGLPVGCLICVLFFKSFARYKASRGGGSSEDSGERANTDGNTNSVNNKLHNKEAIEIKENAKHNLQPPAPPPVPRYTQHTPAALVRPNGVKHPVIPLNPVPTAGTGEMQSSSVSLPSYKQPNTGTDVKQQQEPKKPKETGV